MAKFFGHVTDSTVFLDFYLVIDPGEPGWNRRPGVRVTAAQGKLDRRERTMNLKIALPLALFETPMLKASITVDDPSVPISIDAEAIAEAVRGVVGMDIDLRVIEPGEEDAGQ